MYSNKNISVFGALSPGYTSFYQEVKLMIDWINDPALKDMDPAKIELFKMAASQVEGKSGNAMAPIMMSLIMNANKRGIKFTPDEMSLILQVLKQGKSPSEQQNIDKTVQLVQTMMHNQMRNSKSNPGKSPKK